MIRILALLFLLFASAATAHETTRSYVRIDRTGTAVDLRIRVAFRDIEVAVWIDENLDGAITWAEVQRRIVPISDYLLAGLTLDAGGACVLHHTTTDVSTSGGISYLDVYFKGVCPDPDKPLQVRSRLFMEIDRDHRMFLSAMVGGGQTTTLLSAASPTITISASSSNYWVSLWAYFVGGVQHLLGGYDHITFLIVLILPAVCNRANRRGAIKGVITAITGFTVAHALTLTAVLTNLLRPPSGLIEALIAVTIIVTAIDNIRPFIPAPRAAMAAAFGIIHGCGFATALGSLDLDGISFVVALLGFNLGLEVTQIALVLLLMPILYYFGAGRRTLLFGSTLAGLAGLSWLWFRIAPMLV